MTAANAVFSTLVTAHPSAGQRFSVVNYTPSLCFEIEIISGGNVQFICWYRKSIGLFVRITWTIQKWRDAFRGKVIKEIE